MRALRTVPAPGTPDALDDDVSLRPAGRLTSMASRLQEQLAEFTEGLAKQDAILSEGQDECARITDEQRRVNLDFSANVVKILGEQKELVEQGKQRLETQRSTLRAVNAERDDLLVEKENLAASVAEAHTTIAKKEEELGVVREAQALLEREIKSKDAQLKQTESEVAALHEENAKLLDDLENKNASVDAAEGVRGELAERNEELRAQLRAAESARAEADENISRLMRANASLEEEIAAGESAVAALQEQTRESFEQMTLDREQLVERNRALAEQMTESQTRLDVVRAEAEAIIKEEQERNEALERRHEETLAELEKIGGDAALRPMLIETQQQLLRERERAAALREQNRELEEAAEAVERRKREQEGKLELLNRSLADFEKNREQSAEAMGPGFQGLDLSDDGRSVAGYSDLASVVSEIPNPNDVDGKAAAARRAKAAQNKIKFDAVKAQRNQFKAGLKAAQEEIERMRAEMQTVEALKNKSPRSRKTCSSERRARRARERTQHRGRDASRSPNQRTTTETVADSEGATLVKRSSSREKVRDLFFCTFK